MQTEQSGSHKRIYTRGKPWADQLLATLLFVVPYALLLGLVGLAERHLRRAIVQMVLTPLTLGYVALFIFVALTVLPFVLARRLHPKLVAKVAAVYGENAPDAPMVGYSPGSKMRRYGIVTHMDFGLLFFRPDALVYCGDTITFGLAPRQIEQVTVVEQSLWGTKVPRLLIGWRPEPGQPLQGFTLECWDASTLWQARAAVQALFQRLEQWRHAAITGAPVPPIDRDTA